MKTYKEFKEEFKLDEADTYGWRTNKTPEGHKWNVHSFTHGEGEKVLHSGIEDTRAKAVARAKKHVMPYRRGVKEEVELDEVLDTHKGIQSYIKKSAEKRADLVKNDSITKPDHAEVRRKLEKSNKGFDKAIDKQYKLNKEEVDLDESERAEKKKSLVDMLNRMSKKAEENTKLQKNRDLKKPILSKEEFELQEARAKKEPMQLYHPTYSSAVQHARSQVEKQGYTIHDDDWHDHISMGPKRPSEGKTNQLHIPLHKDGQPTKKVAHIQVYNRGNDIKNNHELNMYVS